MASAGIMELALIGGSCLCSALIFGGAIAGIVIFLKRRNQGQ